MGVLKYLKVDDERSDEFGDTGGSAEVLPKRLLNLVYVFREA